MQAFALALAALGGSCADPAPFTPSASEQSCVLSRCHAGVERIHYGGPPLQCTDCHLGDPNATTKQEAHVTTEVSFNPSTPGATYLEKPSMADLDALDPDVLQFLNPSDYRIAGRTCGSAVLGGGGCHTQVTEDSRLLNRHTLAGTYAGGGFIAGLWDRKARFGVRPTIDPHVPEKLAEGILASLRRLPEDPPAGVKDPVARSFFPVMEQMCVQCHVAAEGPKLPGRYHASGCAACHMTTHDDGRTRTRDTTQDRDEVGHPEVHRFTNDIPDSQCAHCHISHLGRALTSRGVRERSEPEGDEAIGGPNRGAEDPGHAHMWGTENYVKHKGLYWQYGKPYPYFIDDEDDRNEIDETPPDIHTEKGLGCIDCHNMREAHGDRRMAERMDTELDVRCQSCHGRPGELATLQSVVGIEFTKAGTAVGGRGVNRLVFQTDADGLVRQLGKLDGVYHPVTQISRRSDPTEPKYNPRTRMGCELHAGTAARRAALKKAVNALAAKDPAAVAKEFPGLPAGATFTVPAQERVGRLECFTCHNAWTVNCYGCHMVRDDRERYVSGLTGQKRRGAVRSYGMSVLADALALGFNGRHRVSPMVGTSIFLTHIDKDGHKLLDAAPLTTGDGTSGEGNVHNPVHHHTIRRQPRDCTGCHPSAEGKTDKEALLRATGLGTGTHTFTDGKGHEHWLDRQVRADYDGDGSFDDPLAQPLPARILGAVKAIVTTTHTVRPGAGLGPGPGPLDRQTINLLLTNRVLDQRPPPAGAKTKR